MENINEPTIGNDDQLLLESNYKFNVLELSKNMTEKTHQIKPIQDDTIPKKDELSLMVMIFYSIPAFSKMSCLVILR